VQGRRRTLTRSVSRPRPVQRLSGARQNIAGRPTIECAQMYSVLEPAAPVGRSTSKATHKHTQTRTSEPLADSQLARRGGGVMRRPRPAGAPTRPANAGHASSDLKTRATLGCTRRGGAPAVTPPPDRGAEYCDVRVCLCVSLSAIISSELHVRSAPILLCALPVAVARSSSVLPFLSGP